MHRRSKFELYGDILLAVREDIREKGEARITRVHDKAGVPYDRLREYVDDLAMGELLAVKVVGNHEELELTRKAFQFLEKYLSVKDFLKDFGLL